MSFQFLHHGTTVLHFDPDTLQVSPVFLKLERCNGSVTWCRPPWNDQRRGSVGSAGSGSSSSDTTDGGGGGAGGGGVGSGLGMSSAVDAIEDTVSPGLRLKYANRTGESIAYTDEGFVELTHMKDLSLVNELYSFPENVRLVLHKNFAGAMEPHTLRIVYGSSLADNRQVHFFCPPEIGSKWFQVLPKLSTGIKAEDPRMVWLKDQYLFLYYQDDLCMGPLAADAIKVSRNRTSVFVQTSAF